jgi:hypothetical protein
MAVLSPAARQNASMLVIVSQSIGTGMDPFADLLTPGPHLQVGLRQQLCASIIIGGKGRRFVQRLPL